MFDDDSFKSVCIFIIISQMREYDAKPPVFKKALVLKYLWWGRFTIFWSFTMPSRERKHSNKCDSNTHQDHDWRAFFVIVTRRVHSRVYVRMLHAQIQAHVIVNVRFHLHVHVRFDTDVSNGWVTKKWIIFWREGPKAYADYHQDCNDELQEKV